MGVDVAIVDEHGRIREKIPDPTKVIANMLPEEFDEHNPFLSTIDRYGDTVFNGLQTTKFLDEWRRRCSRVGSLEGLAAFHAVERLALRVTEHPHLYLKFIGD